MHARRQNGPPCDPGASTWWVSPPCTYAQTSEETSHFSRQTPPGLGGFRDAMKCSFRDAMKFGLQDAMKCGFRQALGPGFCFYLIYIDLVVRGTRALVGA
jgi:hypothetical protein